MGSAVHARRVAPKATPVVGISSPANNAIFVAPASVTINAAASVTGATLTKVEFLRNGTLLATDTTAPYSYAWTNVAAGTYALTAKAYDNAGGTTTSTAVNITVKTNVAPSVSLTAPTNNAVFTAPATIGLAANASDTDGTIAKVEFFNGTTRLATDTVAPYAHSWTNVAGGTYTLTAKATDDKGAVTTSPAITAIVNRPPSTSITAPANNAVLVAPVNLTVTASASDADGTVSKVEFFRNGTLAATDTTSPYSNAWSNVPLGTHTLTSRATDNRGATTTSSPVTFTVNANVAPNVAITSPAPGARFVYPASVPIAATATDSDGTIARVEFHYDYGLLASDSSSPYAYTWNSPYTGTFVLTARAVDNKGMVTASAPVSITIDANQPPTVTLTGDPPAGELVAAMPPAFRLTAAVSDADGTVASVRFLRYDPLVEAYVEIAAVTQPPFTVQYVAPTLESEYWFRAEATDNGGAVGAAEINYMIVGNRAPQVASLEPGGEAEWSGFVAPATIVVVVEARDFDPAPDRIARVELLANGSPIASLSAPTGSRGEYVYVWRNVPAGSHNLVVRAVDTFGTMGEWSRSVKVVDTSTVASIAVAQPVSGQLYGDPVPLQVSVTPGTASIAHVDYVNALGRKVATSSTLPFAASWTAPLPGRHAITAVAVQNDGVAVDVADRVLRRGRHGREAGPTRGPHRPDGARFAQRRCAGHRRGGSACGSSCVDHQGRVLQQGRPDRHRDDCPLPDHLDRRAGRHRDADGEGDGQHGAGDQLDGHLDSDHDYADQCQSAADRVADLAGVRRDLRCARRDQPGRHGQRCQRFRDESRVLRRQYVGRYRHDVPVRVHLEQRAGRNVRADRQGN